MELNYTPQTANGINIDKAVDINEAFHISRQFWAHQVTRGVLNKPKSFINSVPHMSFVWGEDNVNFLRARYAALQQSELFRGIRYSEDHQQIKAWAPLVMEGRDPLQKIAATRSEVGTDVNYGEITRQLIAVCKSMIISPYSWAPWCVASSATPTRAGRSPWRMPTIVVRSGSLKLNLSLSAPKRRSADPAAGDRHSAGQRVCGLPGRRPVPGLRKSGGGEPPSGEGLRSGRSGRAADVGAAHRYPYYRR